MKKISLLTLFTLFIFSIPNLILNSKLNQKLLMWEFQKLIKFQKIKFSPKITEEIKEKERIIKKSKKGNYETSNLYQKSTPLNQGEFHGILFEGESLKINEKYALFSFFYFISIVEKPPKYERKCVQHLFGKRCKNQQVSQIFLDSELKEVKKKIEKQIVKDALIINLPQENYETFKNILLSKFPNAKF